MKVQQMPSTKGKVLYFVYLPLEYCKELKLEKGDVLYSKLDEENKSIILSKGWLG